MKGGSIASNHVISALPKSCNNVRPKKTFPMGDKPVAGKFYQVASGRKSKKTKKTKKVKKSKKSMKKKVSKKRGGTVHNLSKKVWKLRSLSNKPNPGKFPNVKNRKINWLKNSPKIVGGSAWKASVYSGVANKNYGKHSKHFTGVVPYVQTDKVVHSGRMFKPFKKPIKTFINKAKINNFRMGKNVFHKMRNVNKMPMFRK